MSLMIREIQIKTILRYYLTPVRVAKINNSGQNRYWQGYGEVGTHLHCWWECKLVQPFWKTMWKFLKKLHYDRAIGIYHNLIVCEFEPHIRLCAESSEPGACFRFCVSLAPLPLPCSCSVSLSLSQ